MFNYAVYLQLCAMQAHLKAIQASALPWDAKYRVTFSDACSGRIHALLGHMQTSLQWYDPDADYEDDVMAFSNAVDVKLRELSRELASLDVVQAYEAFSVLAPTHPLHA